MSLRLRLVLGLVALLVLGLGVFGVATYSLYAPSQYQRLDDQLKTTLPYAADQLYDAANIHPQPPGGHQGGDQANHGTGDTSAGGSKPEPDSPGPPSALPPGAYAELLTATGAVKTSITYAGAGGAVPQLPRPIGSVPAAGRIITTASTVGGGSWRVLLSPAEGVPGDVIVVAVPTTGVTSALHRLLLTELVVAVALLALLSAVALVMLRRGLRPLEDMATSARSIVGGNLSRRVAPAQGPTEILQLGSALDTMLADIEAAFAERRATEERLRRFLADASHELRTPLTSIQGFAELFRLGVDNEHIDRETIVRRIEDEAARMKGLVEDLLLLARLDLAPEPQRDRIDLAVLAADACSDAVATAPERPVTLDAPAPVIVSGDVNHLRQAIANLVTNAIRHTPPGTPIEVRASRQDGTALVAVRDHGPGLDADGLAHVFDRFWQADTARTGTGAGLGLSITAAIAGEHKGRVEAANAEGGGALFTLRLPAESPPEEDGERAPEG